MARTDRSKIFSNRFWYMERWNRKSYAKVMVVLRTDSELEDKTVRKWEKFAAVARNWWKRWGKHKNWTLTRPNQQQDLEQDTNSTLRSLKLKYAKAVVWKGCWTYGTNTRTLETKGRCEPNGIPGALITTWWEQGWPDLPKGYDNSRFGGDETQTHPAFKQHDLKLCNFYYFFDIFLLLRSSKELIIENLSLNKWKTWPAEFSENCEKCEKNITRWRLKLRRQIFKPARGSNRQIWNFFWLILIYGMLKSEFVCENYGYFTNGLQIREQNGPKVKKICGGF